MKLPDALIDNTVPSKTNVEFLHTTLKGHSKQTAALKPATGTRKLCVRKNAPAPTLNKVFGSRACSGLPELEQRGFVIGAVKSALSFIERSFSALALLTLRLASN